MARITDEVRRQVRSEMARHAVKARWVRLTPEERVAQLAPARAASSAKAAAERKRKAGK